ncbi:MAG: FAD-dependent oxidoreductase [Parasporobacterium sp.]|nr:FAD-dependent oxidoreductase [Parasporobacterium sp.]
MDKNNIQETRLSADILIVGGGIAGLTAAVAAKEKNPDAKVLVIEKQTAGYGGKANKGGGVLQWFDPQMKADDFLQYHTPAVACYLGNQNVTKKYIEMNNDMIERLDRWGVTIPKFKIPTGPMTFMVGIDLDNCLKMRNTAKKLGVEIVNKVTISDLLTDGDKIAGAVGYSIVDGTFYVVEAKTVILATGSQNYRIQPMWSCGRGDAIAAAYRAGAEMRNCEFGNFSQLYKKNTLQEWVFCENNMFNALGENVTQNFRRFPEADISATAIREWYEQMSMGKGPIHLVMEGRQGGLSAWDRPYGVPFWDADHGKAEGRDPELEMCPGFIGEQSPLNVDENMESTIKGLYGAGDVSYCGSGASGAVPAPPGRNRGSGILNAVYAGILAGEHSAEAVKEAEAPKACEGQIAKYKEEAFAPLFKEEGYRAIDLIDAVQKVVGPVEYSVYMSEYRINIALRKLEKAKAMVGNLKANDLHGVLECHEAEAMLLCAEMMFKAALMRKESRGWFLREDYPVMDNENWLKWIIVKNENGEMTLSTKDIPIDTYPVGLPRF